MLAFLYGHIEGGDKGSLDIKLYNNPPLLQSQRDEKGIWSHQGKTTRVGQSVL